MTSNIHYIHQPSNRWMSIRTVCGNYSMYEMDSPVFTRREWSRSWIGRRQSLKSQKWIGRLMEQSVSLDRRLLMVPVSPSSYMVTQHSTRGPSYLSCTSLKGHFYVRATAVSSSGQLTNFGRRQNVPRVSVTVSTPGWPTQVIVRSFVLRKGVPDGLIGTP